MTFYIPMTQPTQQQAFGARLRQLRREKSALEERDVEQSEVAEAVGDAQPNVARWERGRIPKEDNTIRKLATYYGVNFVWLRYGEGPKFPSQIATAELPRDQPDEIVRGPHDKRRRPRSA